jgi:hypothetical protein
MQRIDIAGRRAERCHQRIGKANPHAQSPVILTTIWQIPRQFIANCLSEAISYAREAEGGKTAAKSAPDG